MKHIVFDASTIILLAKVSVLEIVSKEVEIIVPECVKKEITKKESFDAKLIDKLIKEKRIRIEKTSHKKVNKLTEDFSIEKGEAEALEMAIAKKCIIATDDGVTIKSCKILNVKFTTAVHFLLRLYEKRVINKEIAQEKLKKLEIYGRYSYDIIKEAKIKLGG